MTRDLLNDEITTSLSDPSNYTLARKLVPPHWIEYWKGRGLCTIAPLVRSGRSRFSLTMCVEHTTKGKTLIRMEKMKGVEGEISIHGPGFNKAEKIADTATVREISNWLNKTVNALA